MERKKIISGQSHARTYTKISQLGAEIFTRSYQKITVRGMFFVRRVLINGYVSQQERAYRYTIIHIRCQRWKRPPGSPFSLNSQQNFLGTLLYDLM